MRYSHAVLLLCFSFVSSQEEESPLLFDFPNDPGSDISIDPAPDISIDPGPDTSFSPGPDVFSDSMPASANVPSISIDSRALFSDAKYPMGKSRPLFDILHPPNAFKYYNAPAKVDVFISEPVTPPSIPSNEQEHLAAVFGSPSDYSDTAITEAESSYYYEENTSLPPVSDEVLKSIFGSPNDYYGGNPASLDGPPVGAKVEENATFPPVSDEVLKSIFGSPNDYASNSPSLDSPSVNNKVEGNTTLPEVLKSIFGFPSDSSGVSPNLNAPPVGDEVEAKTTLPPVSDELLKEIFGSPSDYGGVSPSLDGAPAGDEHEAKTTIPPVSDELLKEIFGSPSDYGGVSPSLDGAPAGDEHEANTPRPPVTGVNPASDFRGTSPSSDGPLAHDKDEVCLCTNTNLHEDTKSALKEIFGDTVYFSVPSHPVTPDRDFKGPEFEISQEERDRFTQIFGDAREFCESESATATKRPATDKVCLCIPPKQDVPQAVKDNLHAALGSLIEFRSASHQATETSTAPEAGEVDTVPIVVAPSGASVTVGVPVVTNRTAECYTPAGEPGVCVDYYLCRRDSTVITDGDGLLDYRVPSGCRRELDVCCRLEPHGAAPRATRDTCGCSYPGAQEMRAAARTSHAVFGEFPWMVAILKRSAGDTWSYDDYVGGGSIIHPSVVLTAYHKVQGKPVASLKCRAGEWDTQSIKEVYPYQERNVKKIVKHAEYYRPAVHNSIALLVLAAPYLTAAPHVAAACLTPHSPPAGARCLTMGWGGVAKGGNQTAVVLKKVELPAFPHDLCQTLFRKTVLGKYFKLHESLVCAGGEPGVDTCEGDGGSPLVCPLGEFDSSKHPVRFAIVGMVAYGLDCGNPVPAAYVNVPHFYSWIEEKMAAEGFNSTSYVYD